MNTFEILEKNPERLLEIRGITERRLEDIKSSYAENGMLQNLMNLVAPFRLTPKTALKIYQHFGLSSLEIKKRAHLNFARFPVLDFTGWMPLCRNQEAV